MPSFKKEYSINKSTGPLWKEIWKNEYITKMTGNRNIGKVKTNQMW